MEIVNRCVDGGKTDFMSICKRCKCVLSRHKGLWIPVQIAILAYPRQRKYVKQKIRYVKDTIPFPFRKWSGVCFFLLKRKGEMKAPTTASKKEEHQHSIHSSEYYIINPHHYRGAYLCFISMFWNIQDNSRSVQYVGVVE